MTGPGDQLELAVGPYRNSGLFSDHFLDELLPEWPEFRDAEVGTLLARLRDRWLDERDGLRQANEAQTEEHWIQPVLDALGFHYTVQAGLRVGGGRRQPDYGLFLSDGARRDAAALEGAMRYEHAACVADAKRFDRPLERRRAAGALSEDPVAQIIHYVSVTRCRWRISIPHANGYFAANKQFIAPLPIRLPSDAAELEALGRRLHEASAATLEERHGFLRWLEGAVGARIGDLEGSTAITRYDELTADDLLERLRRNRRRLGAEVESRGFRERLLPEYAASLDRLSGLAAELRSGEDAAEAVIADLYGLTSAQRRLIE